MDKSSILLSLPITWTKWMLLLLLQSNLLFHYVNLFNREEVRLIDFASGKQSKIYTNLSKTNSEITACQVDFKEKIIIYGDYQGTVRALNLANGIL